jgi:hypothetical protein
MGICLHQKKTETSKTCIFLKLFKQDEGKNQIKCNKTKKMIINEAMLIILEEYTHDKRTANNLTWVSQMHIKNTNGIKLNIENFF